MEIKQKVNIHNRFDIYVNGEWVGYAENIILDQMWARLCAGSSYFSNIHFGTGSGTPVANRTSLFAHLGTKTAVNEETIKALPLSSWKRKIVLNPEEFVGSTITEVGIAYGSSASNLVTHAMLKDAEGNPISIEKTSTDVVTIFATVFITFTNTIPELKLIGMPSNNQLINYLTGDSAPSGSFGLSTIENPYSNLGTSATVAWTSDIPNKKRKTNTARFGITSGNGHVKCLNFTNLFELKLPVPGIFSGQSYEGVSIGSGDGVEKSFMLPSANVRQSSLVIKKNGLVVSDYIINIKRQESRSRIANPATPPTDTGNGVALTPDGSVLAVAHVGTPYITTYDWVEGAWVKRPNPATLPTGTGYGVALTSDGSLMAVAHYNSPYITTYDWVEGEWVKRPNPASLPVGTGNGVALTPDGTVMAVAHNSSPYITTYDWVEGEWVKRPNPATLPPSQANGVALTPDGSLMAVAHYSSPYITTYDWVEGAWVKRPNPASLPTSISQGVALTPDGAVMAVVYYYNSPYIATYDWVEGAWVKRPNPATLPSSSADGVALTPDGNLMAVAHSGTPYITTYDWVEGAWVKRPNPASLPASHGNGVALTSDGSLMTVAHTSFPYITTYMSLPFTQITFDTPPALGDAITADYIVDGVHKTNNYVIDVSFAIQFGEGV